MISRLVVGGGGSVQAPRALSCMFFVRLMLVWVVTLWCSGKAAAPRSSLRLSTFYCPTVSRMHQIQGMFSSRTVSRMQYIQGMKGGRR